MNTHQAKQGLAQRVETLRQKARRYARQAMCSLEPSYRQHYRQLSYEASRMADRLQRQL
ncbi:hypothetical protein PPEV_gp159 [Pseudomonas phage EL]|uniref:Uncharacterized protein n=1 Tax=Pseudomonas phage EL TaxID=273133 RepID=Q2Z0S2_9CAUD|nr:hypothetical protein [Pseudomonas aeruginosa]YP_418192.1 hypothetical protein PPEV_gp159 [Pseudomonas phage EL]MDH1421337.1 hypothetical protein [Pseudomonas aeruginosa]CAG27253.1 hypothetical protein [Pseudomonas phage EL]HDU8983318.1 hypothetical protein [Pseudomonas aeruginosa]